MYIGHAGAALAAMRARTSVGLLVLLLATYTPDWVDAGLCLAGVYSPLGMLSHSIPAVLILMLAGFTAYAAATHDWTGALVIAAVILSHMLLDWITGYKPTWPGGPMVGLRRGRTGVSTHSPPAPAALARLLHHARRSSRSPIDHRRRARAGEIAAQMLGSSSQLRTYDYRLGALGGAAVGWGRFFGVQTGRMDWCLRAGAGGLAITNANPLERCSTEERPARSPEPLRSWPPAGSHKFVVCPGR